MNPFPLSWSRISTFLRCPKKFYLKYVEGLEEPPTPEMELGSMVHEAIEKLIRESKEEAYKMITESPDYDTARWLLRNAEKILQGMQIVGVEVKFAVDSEFKIVDFNAPEAHIRGVIDLMVKDGNGYQIYDWKTGWSRPDPRQVLLYAAVLRETGSNITDAGFFLLRTNEMLTFGIDGEELTEIRNFAVRIGRKIASMKEFKPSYNGCEFCAFREKCRGDSESVEDKVRNAKLMRDEANKILSQARDYIRTTGKEIKLSDEVVYAVKESVKVKEKKGEKLELIKALIEKDLYEYLEPKIPAENLDELPSEVLQHIRVIREARVNFIKK